MKDGNRLRVVRAERRVSQLRLAAMTHIHPTRVWKIENGYVAPTVADRHRIAHALGVSERDIWARRSHATAAKRRAQATVNT
jgi:transcriptional regulator with XRE-family HTH domain